MIWSGCTSADICLSITPCSHLWIESNAVHGQVLDAVLAVQLPRPPLLPPPCHLPPTALPCRPASERLLVGAAAMGHSTGAEQLCERELCGNLPG